MGSPECEEDCLEGHDAIDSLMFMDSKISFHFS